MQLGCLVFLHACSAVAALSSHTSPREHDAGLCTSKHRLLSDARNTTEEHK